MDERASFEARPVLGPRRSRLARLTLLLPAVVLVAIAVAGVSGSRSDHGSAAVAEPTASALATALPRPHAPAQALGLTVHRLDEVDPFVLGRDDVIAVAGWYATTAITDCPPLAAIYRAGALPEDRADIDPWAYCVRSGVLSASQPGLDEPSAGVPAVVATLAIGVVAPPELDVIGAAPTEVVLIGRFVPSGDPCYAPFGCGREFVVDHVGWTPDA